MADSVTGETNQGVVVPLPRPVLGGSMFQTTAPSVSDGEAVYVNLDAAGRARQASDIAASVDVSEAVTADQDDTVAGVAGLRLIGWSARESDATPAVATFGIVNGATVAGGTTILRIELPANGSAGESYGPEGLDAANGLTIDHIAGTFDVYLYHKTLL